MVEGRDTKKPTEPEVQLPLSSCRATKVGEILMNLYSAIEEAERCRKELEAHGLLRTDWINICMDVNPETRLFLARQPGLLEKIVLTLREAREPLSRDTLMRKLQLQGAGTARNIRRCIQLNLGNGNLIRRGKKIGLPEMM